MLFKAELIFSARSCLTSKSERTSSLPTTYYLQGCPDSVPGERKEVWFLGKSSILNSQLQSLPCPPPNGSLLFRRPAEGLLHHYSKHGSAALIIDRKQKGRFPKRLFLGDLAIILWHSGPRRITNRVLGYVPAVRYCFLR